jgi:hypothetical protein
MKLADSQLRHVETSLCPPAALQQDARCASRPSRKSAHSFWSVLLAALPLCCNVTVANAQSAQEALAPPTWPGGIVWELRAVGSAVYTALGKESSINKEACDANVDLHLLLSNIPAGYKYLEVWVGDDCQNGDRTIRVGVAECQFVASKEQDPTTTVNTDFRIPAKPACDLGDGKRSYYVLATNTERSTNTAEAYAMIPLVIDQTPPNPPSDLVVDADASGFPIAWTAAGDDAVGFWLVVDRNATAVDETVGQAMAGDAGSATVACTSQVLREGAFFNPRSILPNGVTTRYVTPSSITLPITSMGAGVAAVAVMSQDSARNDSLLSNVACVRAAPQAARPVCDGAKEGNACAALGVGRATTLAPLPVLVAFGLLGLWRRRPRRT